MKPENQPSTRLCRKCGTLKPLSEFAIDRWVAFNCKACNHARQIEWRRENRQKVLTREDWTTYIETNRNKLLARLASHRVIDANGCWLWVGANSQGYGSLGISPAGRITIARVSRLILALTSPFPIWDENIFACHSCDNPPCWNPEHLFPGTQADNLADMRAKGRHPVGDRHGLRLHPESVNRGEAHWNSKLTMAEAAEIKSRFASGESVTELASSYKVNRATVADVCAGKTWRHA